MAEECAEVSVTGKVLEFGVVDDDGAGDGLAGLRVDHGGERGVGLGGDELGEIDAGGLGEGVEGFQPTGGNGGFDGGFEALAEAGGGGCGGVDGFFRERPDFGDGAVVVEQGGADEAEDGGGNQREQQAKGGGGEGAGFLRISGHAAGAGQGFEDFPDQEKGNAEGEDGQAGGDPGGGFAGPIEGEGGRGLPDAEADPRADAQDEGADDHPRHPAQGEETGARGEDDQRGAAEAELRDGIGGHGGVNAEIQGN